MNDPRIRKWLGQVIGKEDEDLSRHDKWLCMMYPRLRLLQKLMADDGVIFISIDDAEYASLKQVCDEIYGSSCFVSNISWQRTYSTRNDSKGIVNEVEHVLCYNKQPNWNPNKLPRTAEMDSKYKNPDNDVMSWRTDNAFAPGAATHQGSGTVVNVRKSMWIHPTKDRAISIREAARLQTFPDSFVFYGSKDKQYQQVGNAVPPVLAKAIAEKLLTYLEFSADNKAIDARILRIIKETPDVKQCEIASLLKLSPPYVGMRIADLMQRCILICIKTNGKKGWQLAEKEDHDGG